MPEWHEVNVGDKRVLNWFLLAVSRAAILRYEPSINMLKVAKDAYHQTLASPWKRCRW